MNKWKCTSVKPVHIKVCNLNSNELKCTVTPMHSKLCNLNSRQFLHTASDIVAGWSKCRNPQSINCKNVAVSPSVGLKEWAKAYQWAVDNKNKKVGIAR